MTIFGMSLISPLMRWRYTAIFPQTIMRMSATATDDHRRTSRLTSSDTYMMQLVSESSLRHSSKNENRLSIIIMVKQTNQLKESPVDKP